jgi:hypothetical protein
MQGDADDPARRGIIRFVGGPWAGHAARYVEASTHADIVLRDGRYRYARRGYRGETIFVYVRDDDEAGDDA